MEDDRNIEEKLLLRLLTEKKYVLLRELLAEMNEADIAGIMDSMENEDSLRLFRILPKNMAAEVFADLELDDQAYIIQSLSET